MLDFSIETKYQTMGYKYICGIDEAGRGPLCGPVVAAACILPMGVFIEGLNDSKKLTEQKREKIFEQIKKEAITYSIAQSTVREIDELNILGATLLAMHRAVEGLSPAADFLLVDGNVYKDFNCEGCCVIKGDSLSPSIAAASILAKVTRDRICKELDCEYPQYGIAQHKGYGTKMHMDALRKLGATPIHRKQFIRFLDK